MTHVSIRKDDPVRHKYPRTVYVDPYEFRWDTPETVTAEWDRKGYDLVDSYRGLLVFERRGQ